MKFDLQKFAETATNTTKSTDLAPVISVDVASRFKSTIDGLREVLGVANMLEMAEGSTIKTYKLTKDRKSGDVAEGAEIPLSKYGRVVDQTITVGLKKHRIEVTAEAIQQFGQTVAINMRDDEMLLDTQYEVLDDFYAMLTGNTNSTAVTADTFQKALASGWAKLRDVLKRKNATPIYFVSTADVADYLGSAAITVQNNYGMSYINDFLGLGTVVITPELASGTVYVTAKENICGLYVPVANSTLGSTFSLVTDATGYVGMKHFIDDKTLCLNTLEVHGVKFYPELKDAVIKVTINAPTTAPEAGK